MASTTGGDGGAAVSPTSPQKLTPVGSTAVLTLRARAEEHGRPDGVLDDPEAARALAALDWPAQLDAWYDDTAQCSLALRAAHFDEITRRWAAQRPLAGVVELGGGLSTRPQRLTDLTLRWALLDRPDVSQLRAQLGLQAGLELRGSVLDHAWMDALEPGPWLFIAEGLLYYLPKAEVHALLAALGRRFAGSAILFDLPGSYDAPALAQAAASVGAALAWSHEGDLDQALPQLGLDPAPGFTPAELSDQALQRYWPRWPPLAQAGFFFARAQPQLWAARSGNLLGLLRPDAPRAAAAPDEAHDLAPDARPGLVSPDPDRSLPPAEPPPPGQGWQAGARARAGRATRTPGPGPWSPGGALLG